jgi:2-dehydropantoate 2-reductase
MRVLFLGAGATGGYYGGRLVEAGADVSFLVRPRRAGQLRRTGLVIKSEFGDFAVKNPQIVERKNGEHFDVIVLSCKAYDLSSAIEAIEPFVEVDTMIMPLLNGMKHLDILAQRFGKEKVIGGTCIIASTLDDEGRILHLNDLHLLRFGELSGEQTPRIMQFTKTFQAPNNLTKYSETILHDLWEKWVILSTLAGATCLMRGSIGDILNSAGGEEFLNRLFDECVSIATAHGYPPRPPLIQQAHEILGNKKSTATTSMFRDMDNGSRIEADHIIGDLVAKGDEKKVAIPLLKTAYCNTKVYERRPKLPIFAGA